MSNSISVDSYGNRFGGELEVQQFSGVKGEITGLSVINNSTGAVNQILTPGIDEPIRNLITNGGLASLCGKQLNGTVISGWYCWAGTEGNYRYLGRCSYGANNNPSGSVGQAATITDNVLNNPTLDHTSLTVNGVTNPHGTQYFVDGSAGIGQMKIRVSYRFPVVPTSGGINIENLPTAGGEGHVVRELGWFGTGNTTQMFSRITLPSNQYVEIPRNSYLQLTYEITVRFPGCTTNPVKFGDGGYLPAIDIGYGPLQGWFRWNAGIPATTTTSTWVSTNNQLMRNWTTAGANSHALGLDGHAIAAGAVAAGVGAGAVARSRLGVRIGQVSTFNNLTGVNVTDMTGANWRMVEVEAHTPDPILSQFTRTGQLARNLTPDVNFNLLSCNGFGFMFDKRTDWSNAPDPIMLTHGFNDLLTITQIVKWARLSDIE